MPPSRVPAHTHACAGMPAIAFSQPARQPRACRLSCPATNATAATALMSSGWAPNGCSIRASRQALTRPPVVKHPQAELPAVEGVHKEVIQGAQNQGGALHAHTHTHRRTQSIEHAVQVLECLLLCRSPGQITAQTPQPYLVKLDLHAGEHSGQRLHVVVRRRLPKADVVVLGVWPRHPLQPVGQRKALHRCRTEAGAGQGRGVRHVRR